MGLPRAFLEQERSGAGEVVSVATLLLVGTRCPFECLMCDLGDGMLPGPTPAASLPRQVDEALAGLPPAQQLKLYNAGSFFDQVAVPPEDLPALAARARRFERLIVESHPSLIGDTALRFRDLLGGTAFEVAIGLETIHPEVLPKLNKRMTAEGFAGAAKMLSTNGIDVRAFVLAGLPFAGRRESIAWAKRSIAFAFDSGASVVSLIPTRIGTAAMERLAAEGQFTSPDLEMLEEVSASGLGPGRLFVDTWDLQRFSNCELCFESRLRRLLRQNLSQAAGPLVECAGCGNSL